MKSLFLTLLIMLTTTVGNTQILDRVCPDKDTLRQKQEAQRLRDMIALRCEMPWQDRMFNRLENFVGGAWDTIVLDGKEIKSRVTHLGMSEETYKMVNFEGLDSALEACFPNDPVQQKLFLTSLVWDDAVMRVGGMATGLVVGYYTISFVGGKVAAVTWTPVKTGLVKAGASPKAIKALGYTAGAGVMSYLTYKWYHIEEEKKATVRTVEDYQSEVRKRAEARGILIEEVEVEMSRDLCLETIHDAQYFKNPAWDKQTKTLCGLYIQQARTTLLQLEEKLGSCKSDIPEFQRAHAAIKKDLDEVLFQNPELR